MKKIAMVMQPLGETNPMVIMFIVLSGYCIHRNGFRIIDKEKIKVFYKKRFIRIVPLFLLGVLIGIVCWKCSLNMEITQKCTGTVTITGQNIIYKISGLAILYPFHYIDTYCGNAPLITISIIMYLYFLYPIILQVFLGGGKTALQLSFVLWWFATFVYIVFHSDLWVWWHNASLIAFLPYWWIGVWANDVINKETIIKKVVLLLCFLILTFMVLFININPMLKFCLAELRKLTAAMGWSFLIKWLDKPEKRPLHINDGICDLGKISFSLYCIHGPIVIFLLGVNVDILSITIVVFLIGGGIYYLIEKKLSELMWAKLEKYTDCKC